MKRYVARVYVDHQQVITNEELVVEATNWHTAFARVAKRVRAMPRWKGKRISDMRIQLAV